MKEIMAFLAENWAVGYGICAVVCVAVYVEFSVRLVRSAREVNMDVGVSAMIPLWQLVVWVRKLLHIRRESKPIDMDEEIEL